MRAIIIGVLILGACSGGGRPAPSTVQTDPPPPPDAGVTGPLPASCPPAFDQAGGTCDVMSCVDGGWKMTGGACPP